MDSELSTTINNPQNVTKMPKTVENNAYVTAPGIGKHVTAKEGKSQLKSLICVIGISLILGIIWIFQLEPVRPIAPPFNENVRKMFYIHSKHYEQNNVGLEVIADPNKSTISLIGGKMEFRVGDTIRVLVRMRDVNGEIITEGGDILRIWLKEGKSNVNGEIQDHENGSYTGTVLLPWRGKPTLYVSIANSRQHISYVLSVFEKYGLLYGIYGKFVNKQNNVSVMPCSPKPNVEGWKDVCNLTDMNYNVLWYCEKPKNRNISCDDWKYVNMERKPYSCNTKKEWIRKHKQMILKAKISIRVNGEKDVIQASDQNCHNINRTLTWIQNSPSGFYYKGSWVNPWCRTRLQRRKHDYLRCLRNRHIFLIGDSNIRSFATYLLGFLGFGKPLTGNRNWKRFLYAERRDNKLSLYFVIHGMPFYSPEFIEKELVKPSFVHLDEIGKGNNSVVIIHMFLHVSRALPEVFRRSVKRLRKSVENLLKRSPGVDIIIKGPHAITYFKMLDPVDFLSRVQRQIWFEEFQGLHHKVIYMDMWDITAGTESIHAHPDSKIVIDQIFNTFSYICKT